MTRWGPILTRAAVLWVPVAAAVTGISALIYAVDLNSLRSAANDPQIQMVEEAVTRLDAGVPPRSVVPPTAVDMSSSLQSYVVLFDPAGRAVASSVTLHGRQPDFPVGVFDTVRGGGQDRITWQPEPGVRSAVVLERWHGGFVLAGRSLRLTEERETDLEILVAAGWLGTLALTAVAAVVVGIFNPLTGPTAPSEGGNDGGEGPPRDRSEPGDPARSRAVRPIPGVARPRTDRGGRPHAERGANLSVG
jgi:hypothetical protein